MDGGGGGSTVTQEAKCDKAIGGAPSPPSPFPGDNDGPTTTATTASPQSSAPSSVSGNANTDLGPVVIFVDVDGVLNTNWHGATAPMATEANHIEPRLVDNIAELTTRIASELQLASHIVVSSTWRLQPSQNSVLMAALHERGLDDLLHPTTPYTPNLGHRSSSSGRASEIGEWLYRQDPEPQLFLVLDDLNILFDDASGKPITGRIRDCNFVHTISETQAASAGAAADADADADAVGATVGLTSQRVEVAMRLLRRQLIGANNQCGYTPRQWSILARSGIPVHLLKKRTCPLWVREAARAHLNKHATRAHRGAGANKQQHQQQHQQPRQATQPQQQQQQQQNKRWCCAPSSKSQQSQRRRVGRQQQQQQCVCS